MAQLDKSLAQFFCMCWDSWTEGPSEELQAIMDDTPLVEQREATEADVEAGDLPEGCELGDNYYALSTLGHAAWDLAHSEEDEDNG